MKYFHVEDRPEALLIRFDRPPVNAITVDTARELGAVLDAANRLPPGKAVVITGTGKCFSAGLI
jgi:enoyl-CoA hydratase/carnithine racemase